MKMLLKKPTANKAVGGGGGAQRKSVESVHHWAFLEEIEAPMWVDFTIEDQLMHNDIDDDWFRTVHPFHQRTSYDLISSYSLLREGELKSSEKLRLSPEIPGSVSKSRGNHYRSRKWDEIGQVAAMSKQHPIRILGGKASSGNISRKLTRKITSKSSITKPVTSSRNPEGSDPKAGFTSECTSTSTITSESPRKSTKASLTDLKDTSLSNSDTVSESNQQSAGSELPNCTVGHTTQLLSSIRISLPRSCVTRHASRVEVKGEQLKCCKPSRSNSSVGSSFNPECNLGGNQLAANKGVPESRNYRKALHPTNGKVSCVWKTDKQHVPDRGSSLNLKQGLSMAAAKPIHQDANSKVLHCKQPRKPLRLLCKVENAMKEKVVAKSKKPKSYQKVNDMARLSKETSLTNLDCTKKASAGKTHGKDFNGLFNVKMKSERRAPERNPANASLRMHFR